MWQQKTDDELLKALTDCEARGSGKYGEGAAEAIRWLLTDQPNETQVSRQLLYCERDYDMGDDLCTGAYDALRWSGNESSHFRFAESKSKPATKPRGIHPAPFPADDPVEDPAPWGERHRAALN